MRIAIYLCATCVFATSAAQAQDAPPPEPVDTGVVIGAPGPMSIGRPAVRDRGVFISQVGNGNTARVAQSAPSAAVSAHQRGNNNHLQLSQNGYAVAYAHVAQSGNANNAALAQGGADGGNTLYVSQGGNRNTARATQFATTGENGAMLTQTGSGNKVQLAQSGADNQAELAQSGDNNRMVAAQEGAGNRLIWTQTGNNLLPLGIHQTGNQAIQITQTK